MIARMLIPWLLSGAAIAVGGWVTKEYLELRTTHRQAALAYEATILEQSQKFDALLARTEQIQSENQLLFEKSKQRREVIRTVEKKIEASAHECTKHAIDDVFYPGFTDFLRQRAIHRQGSDTDLSAGGMDAGLRSTPTGGGTD